MTSYLFSSVHYRRTKQAITQKMEVIGWAAVAVMTMPLTGSSLKGPTTSVQCRVITESVLPGEYG